eukprot:11785800-Alexandrium_andersonii.AAC.1
MKRKRGAKAKPKAKGAAKAQAAEQGTQAPTEAATVEATPADPAPRAGTRRVRHRRGRSGPFTRRA